MSDNKKKKKKVVYYDDGRTIADMSGLYGKKEDNHGQNDKDTGSPSPSGLFNFRPGHTPKDWLKTYWSAMKMTFLPMLVTIGIVCAAFGLLYLILELAS